jgi:hypothetical protein
LTGLKVLVGDYIESKLMDKVQKGYVKNKTFEDEKMANTRVFNTLNDENFKRIADLKFSEEKFNEKLKYYLMVVDYEEEKKRYTDKRELAGLKTELAKYAKLEEVKKDSANLKE